MNSYYSKYLKYKTKYINLSIMIGGNTYKIIFFDRLKHMSKIYNDEDIIDAMSIQELIKFYYERVNRNKLDSKLLDIIIEKYNLTVNNIKINKDNLNSSIKDLINKEKKEIMIIIENKIKRDIDGYNIMKNLLLYIASEKDSYNIVSELSYNVQSVISYNVKNVISKFVVDMDILEKNILQQTQYKKLSSEFKNINIILYDMEFFNKESSEEQIFNLVNLEEKDIKEFNIINPDKIKKFVKPSGRLFSPNFNYINQEVANKYTFELNKIFARFRDTQIQWYIVNFKNTSTDDKIDVILKDLGIPSDLIHVYGFSG
jgi:hypothetical protein